MHAKLISRTASSECCQGRQAKRGSRSSGRSPGLRPLHSCPIASRSELSRHTGPDLGFRSVLQTIGRTTEAEARKHRMAAVAAAVAGAVVAEVQVGRIPSQTFALVSAPGQKTYSLAREEM